MNNVCLILLLFAADALAHGGGSFRGPPGSVPPGVRGPGNPPQPLPACSCAGVRCTLCFSEQLATKEQLAVHRVVARGLKRWDDFATLQTSIRYQARKGRLEAHTVLAPAPLYAVIGGRLKQGSECLPASLAVSRDAKAQYMDIRRRGLDPLLVTRRDAASVDVRVFPVSPKQLTVVELDGVGLAPPRRRGAPRLYCYGDCVLVVRDGVAGPGEFADVTYRRALRFLSRRQAMWRHGWRLFRATRFEHLAALECAVTGQGTKAVSEDRVLLAAPRRGPVTPAESTAQDTPPVAPRRISSALGADVGEQRSVAADAPPPPPSD